MYQHQFPWTCSTCNTLCFLHQPERITTISSDEVRKFIFASQHWELFNWITWNYFRICDYSIYFHYLNFLQDAQEEDSLDSLGEVKSGGRPLESHIKSLVVNHGVLMSTTEFWCQNTLPEADLRLSHGEVDVGDNSQKKIHKLKQKYVITFTWRETPFAPPLETWKNDRNRVCKLGFFA